MISLSNATKVYLSKFVETRALVDVSLSIGSSEFVAICGPSGSGKTTLLSILGLIESLSGGSYEFNGEDVTHLSANAMADLRNREFGFVFQEFLLIPFLSLRENIEIPLYLNGSSAKESRQRSTELLSQMGLLGRADHLPDQVSGGQGQRTAIARALANHPKVILADEPTGHLDTTMASEIMSILLHIVKDQGATLILATHNTKIADTADRKIALLDGQLMATAGPV